MSDLQGDLKLPLTPCIQTKAALASGSLPSLNPKPVNPKP